MPDELKKLGYSCLHGLLQAGRHIFHHWLESRMRDIKESGSQHRAILLQSLFLTARARCATARCASQTSGPVCFWTTRQSLIGTFACYMLVGLWHLEVLAQGSFEGTAPARHRLVWK